MPAPSETPAPAVRDWARPPAPEERVRLWEAPEADGQQRRQQPGQPLLVLLGVHPEPVRNLLTLGMLFPLTCS